MRRRWKYLLFPFRLAALLALLVLLAAAGLFGLVKLMITPEGLKEILVTQLQDALGRPVQIEDAQFLIYQGLRVRGLRVIDSPEFGGQDFLSSDTAVAKYRWTALLRRRLEFDELRLVAPRIRLFRRQDGVWNVEDMLVSGSTRAARSSQGFLFLPVSLGADVISVDRGLVSITDLKRGTRLEARDFGLRVENFSLEAPFTAAASFRNTGALGGLPLETRVSLHGSMSLAGLRWDEARLSLDRLVAEVNGRPLRAALSLKGFARPEFDLKAALPALDSLFLSSLLGRVPEGVSLPESSWTLQGRAEGDGRWRVDALEAASGPLRLKARGSLDLQRAGQPWSLDAELPPAPLDRLGALWSDWARRRLTGEASGSVALSGRLGARPKTAALDKVLLNLRGFGGVFARDRRLSQVDAVIVGADNLQAMTLAVQRGSFTGFGSTLSNINLALRVHQGEVDIERAALSWGDSRLRLRGKVRGLNPPREVLLDGSVDRLQLDNAIQAVGVAFESMRSAQPQASPQPERPWSRAFKYSIPKEFPATAGRVRVGEVLHPSFRTVNLELLWNLRGVSPGLERVDGDIQVGFGPGRAMDIPSLQDAHKILRVIFLPFVYMHRLNNMAVLSASTAYPQTLDFNRIYGEYGLKKGVVDVRLFHVDSPQLLAYADGTVDFPREDVGLHLLTRLNNSRGPLPEYLVDENGRPSIGFFVEGNLNLPSLRLDFRKMEKDGIEKALAQGLKRSQKVFTPF